LCIGDVLGKGIAAIREEIALLTFQSILDIEQKFSDNDFKVKMDLLEAKINSIDVDKDRILSYRVCIPKSKTGEMADGLNSKFYTRAKDVFTELDSGGMSVSGMGFWRDTEEPMEYVKGNISISKWKECIQQFGEFLKDMQFKLQQQSVYFMIGEEAKELCFYGDSVLSRFPEQNEFDTIDPNFSETQDKEKGNSDEKVVVNNITNIHNHPPGERIETVSPKQIHQTGLDLDKNSREKIRLADIFRSLEQKLMDITYAQSEQYKRMTNDDILIKKITTGGSNSSPIELLMANENGGLLFTSIFKEGLNFKPDSLNIIRCKCENGIYYPIENLDFFSDIKLAHAIVSDEKIMSNADIQKFLAEENKSEIDLVNANSLLHCVIDSKQKLQPNHPAIWHEMAVKKIEDNIKGKGTQIDALRHRFQKLTWGMNYYVREESEIKEFYTDFLNYPMLAIYGIGGVGKTALMMKLVWDSIQEDPNRFNHYLILTSKGKDQGTLKLLPGKTMVTNKFSERSTIAKYFESYSSFIKSIAEMNTYFDPKNAEYNLDSLTDYAINALKNDKILLVIDNFEDFEHGNTDFPRFKKFFDRFKSLVRPDSRIIITTRGDGKIAKNPKTLFALKPADTASLFVKRILWLRQKEHYRNILPQDQADLIGKIRDILQSNSPAENLSEADNKRNADIIKRIGHPASILLLAASINDDAEENPVTYFESEIKDLKEGKIGRGKEDFYEYCVKKSLTTQQEFPYLERLVERLSYHERIDETVIEDEVYKINNTELSIENTRKIIDILVRYSFLEKTNAALNDSYIWNNTAKAFISGMSDNDVVKRELSVEDTKVNSTFINKLESLIDLFEGRRATIAGGRGGGKGSQATNLPTDIAMSTQFEKISHMLEDAFKKILRPKCQEDLDLAVRLFQSSHNFLQNIIISRRDWEEDVIEDLVRNSIHYIEKFSNMVLSEVEKDEPILNNDLCNGLLKSATLLWNFSMDAEREEYLLKQPWIPKLVLDMRKVIVELCVNVTSVDFDYNSEGTDAGITVLKEIYLYNQFYSSRWRHESEPKVEKSQLEANIQLLESWVKIYKNLDKYSPEDFKPLLKEFATVCVNLASIHHNTRLRPEYLKLAETYSAKLDVKLQNTVSRLKDLHETGWFEVDQLAKLYLRFNSQIPIGTTIILDRDPEMLASSNHSSIYTMKIKSKWKSLDKEFLLYFSEAIRCNNSPYLVDILHQPGENSFSVKARRGHDGELIPVRRPKDNVMNKNWMLLEEQILNWANNYIKENGPVDRFEIEIEAERDLLPHTSSTSLQALKDHLRFVHPKLSVMSSEVNFATMIVTMAISHKKYQLVIDNNSNLANKFTSSKPSKVDKVSSETYPNNSFYSRSGFGLPKDPLTLATVLIDFQERQSHLTDSRIRYVLGTWVDICDKNNMSIGKAKRLFQFISDKNKYSPKLNVIFDNVWDACIDVLDLSNRMEQNMKTHNRKLANKYLRSYFERVHVILAHRRSRDE
jgi:hypothetical protein